MATFTQAQIDALSEAIAQGAKKVKYGDKEVEYRSLKEMQEILQVMKEDLGLITFKKRVVADFKTGL